ncbi:RNA-directed DNA polymerase, eukaryota, reverse transcriptase zinc-binding domain protein [Tanacetum coccineum]
MVRSMALCSIGVVYVIRSIALCSIGVVYVVCSMALCSIGGIYVVRSMDLCSIGGVYVVRSMALCSIRCVLSSKVPGPDGFTFKFFKKHWNTLDQDIVSYVKDFEASGSIPRSCNSSFITLVPKVEDPLVIGDFHPISLIGNQYKIIAKILANRLSRVLPSVVREAQMVYIKGCQIIDGPLMFKIERGLRQGDPVSPFLFILAVEALKVALLEATSNNIFKGIKVGKDMVHISHLQFTDDALIMGEWSRSNAMNLSRILTCFHLAFGLKVNFNKSNLYGVGVSNVELNSLASTVGCIAAQFPCTYLGLPIGASMSRCHHWTPLVDRFHKWLSTWKSKSLSIGGRLTPNKSVLGSLGVYYFSTYKAPKKIINKLESIRRNFFWGGSMDDNEIPWIAWEKVLSPRDHGGLGIGGLRTCNQAMLTKWRWRFRTEKQALWFNINLPSIFKIKLGNGQSTSFWHDPWIGGSPLEDLFPRLYRLDTNPNCNVFDRKPTDIVHVSSDHLVSFGPKDATSPPRLLFQWAWHREPRTTPELEELANLVSLLSQLHLTISEDTWEFSIDDSIFFIVKGMRCYITSMSPPASYVTTRWNRIVLLKVNINTWRVMNGRMATRSNLDRRGVDLDYVRCPLCDDGIETKDDIFVHCKVAKELCLLASHSEGSREGLGSMNLGDKEKNAWDKMTTSSANNSVFRGFFEKQKLTGPNFIDWYRQLRIVLSIEDKLNYLEQPLPHAPVAPEGQQVAPKIIAAHNAWIKGSKKIAELMLMTMELEIQ